MIKKALNSLLAPLFPIPEGNKTKTPEIDPPAPKGPKIKNSKYRAMAVAIRDPEKNSWNPLRNFPRNRDCFCASGKKAKRCCLPRMKAVCSRESAEYIKAHWADFLSGKLNLKDVVPEEPKQ